MGLDLYVGSLTRYYSGEWQLLAERLAEEMGTPFSILGDHPTKSGEEGDREEVRAAVLEWKKKLIVGQAHRLPLIKDF